MSALTDTYPCPDDDWGLKKIIELGKHALRQRRAEELAFDLLGLDGVRVALDEDPGLLNKVGSSGALAEDTQSRFAGSPQELGRK